VTLETVFRPERALVFRPQEPSQEPLAGAIDGSHRDKAGGRSEHATIIGSFALLSMGYFYAAIARSTADYLRMDEILAVSAARQSSLSGIWNAIWVGTDFSPPTYHVLLHGLVATFGGADGHFVWRVPSILAIYGAALCTYALLVKSQVSRAVAVLAFGIVLAFNLFDFAVQARQYGLLALGLAVALLLWSAIKDTGAGKVQACGLWLVLTACLCLHFYGIIEVAVIGAAELLYWISRRRFRITVWTALGLTVPVVAALYPIASHLATFNAGDNLAPGYYAKPTLGALLDAIFEVLGGSGFGTLLLVAAFLLVGTAYFLERSKLRRLAAAEHVPIRPAAGLSEFDIVMIALCLLPALTFGFSLFVTGSFSPRYMAAGALLPAIAAAAMLDRLPWRRFVALGLVPLIVGVLILRAHAPDPIANALAVVQKPAPSGPIVVGEGLLYIELMDAADASTRSKLVYLKRPAGAFSPDPTNENEVTRLATFNPEYRVDDRAAFLEANARFNVLYRPNESTDTTMPALLDQGLLGSPVTAEHGILLFRSSPPTPPQQHEAVR
jgi:hypothetical protein